MKISSKGIAHLHKFESLELKAYPDPGSGGDPWTIGYGHTGPEVSIGLVINLEQAEALLKEDLARFNKAVEELISVALNQNEFDALVCFTYNVGEGALKNSTLRRRLNAGEDKSLVFSEELPRWVNGASGPMPGLVRRREAEVKMALTSKDYFLPRAAKYFNAEPHQEAAWRTLEDSLTSEQLEAFKLAYSPSQPPVETPKPIKSQFPLDVPYYYQLDSQTGHAERSCFSSAMAMAIEYIDPDAFDGDDDDYLRIVLTYGDTVSADAQLAAARSLGMDVEFKTNGSEEDLIKQLDLGIPIPMGILHKGPVSNPSGGGHYVTLIGYDNTHFWVHDPFGQLNLVEGGYTIDNGPKAGRNQRYTRKNLMARWLINKSGKDGWWMKFS